MSPDQPLLVCFCGPNGAGKSTLRRLTLAGLSDLPFINADEIAQALFGPDPHPAMAYEAAQEAARQRQSWLDARHSFSFETVMSHPSKVAFLREAREAGYFVIAHFVGLDSAQLSLARVVQRVSSGGHDVPDEKIQVRFPRVMEQLQVLLDLPDELLIYDNSSSAEPFRLVARLESGRLMSLAARVPAWLAPLHLETLVTGETLRLP